MLWWLNSILAIQGRKQPCVLLLMVIVYFLKVFSSTLIITQITQVTLKAPQGLKADTQIVVGWEAVKMQLTYFPSTIEYSFRFHRVSHTCSTCIPSTPFLPNSPITLLYLCDYFHFVVLLLLFTSHYFKINPHFILILRGDFWKQPVSIDEWIEKKCAYIQCNSIQP